MAYVKNYIYLRKKIYMRIGTAWIDQTYQFLSKIRQLYASWMQAIYYFFYHYIGIIRVRCTQFHLYALTPLGFG